MLGRQCEVDVAGTGARRNEVLMLLQPESRRKENDRTWCLSRIRHYIKLLLLYILIGSSDEFVVEVNASWTENY